MEIYHIPFQDQFSAQRRDGSRVDLSWDESKRSYIKSDGGLGYCYIGGENECVNILPEQLADEYLSAGEDVKKGASK